MIEPDYKKAFQWATKAAAQGNSTSQFFMGTSYEYGMGVELDYEQAYVWYALAASNGENANDQRDKVAQYLTPKRLAEAKLRMQIVSQVINMR